MGAEIFEEESGVYGIIDVDKKKVLFLIRKDKEISYVSWSMLRQPNVSPPIKNIFGSTPSKYNSWREGRMIPSILLNKDSR